VSRAALQRDLDNAYEHQGAIERQISDVDIRIKEAGARGETAVAEALQPELDRQISRLRDSMSDIEAIREALARSTEP
jgi:hypothetical protein